MSVMKKIIMFLSLLLLQSTVSVAQDAPSETLKAVEGIWLTKEGKSHLKIVPCEQSLCNEVVWLKNPLDRYGKPQTDKLNKSSEYRGRPIIGISILLEMVRVSETMWKGWIYDPEKGKAFQGHARLLTPGTIEVKGCHAVLPICKTHIWKKVSELADYKIEPQAADATAR